MNFIIHIDLTRKGEPEKEREQDSRSTETSQPEDGREKTHPIDERQPFRGGLLPYTQLPEREAAGSGDIEPGHPNTFTKTAEDLPETRKRTEIHMDGGKRGEGSCTPSYCCQWDRSYITHHKRSMGKGMDLY